MNISSPVPWMLSLTRGHFLGMWSGCWERGLTRDEFCAATSKRSLHLQLAGGSREGPWWSRDVSEVVCWDVPSCGHRPRALPVGPEQGTHLCRASFQMNGSAKVGPLSRRNLWWRKCKVVMLDFFSGVVQMMPMAWMQIRGISAPPAAHPVGAWTKCGSAKTQSHSSGRNHSFSSFLKAGQC